VHVKKSDLLGNTQGVFKVLVRFAWEPGHDVSCDRWGQAWPANGSSDAAHHVEVVANAILAIHASENRIRT
jgi:hypothetical protein